MSPHSLEISDIRARAKRQNRLLAVLVIGLVLFSGVSIWAVVTNFGQSSDTAELRDIVVQSSACRTNPDGLDCKIGHANSVALTTHEEACFILAQGGLKCKAKALPEAEERQKALLDSVQEDEDISKHDNPGDNIHFEPNTHQRLDVPSAPNSTVPGTTRPPHSSPPGSNPSPESPAPKPPTVDQPPRDNPVQPDPVVPSRPLITLPPQLKPTVEVCVNALGIRVVC